MPKKLILVFFLISKLLIAQPSIDSISYKFMKTALIEQKGYFILKDLCEFGPRLSGSKNLNNALMWLKNKASELGFDSVYLQKVMVPNWKRGKYNICQTIGKEPIKFNILALGMSVGTPKDGIISKVIEVKNFMDLYNKKDSIKGKIVYFSKEFYNGYFNPLRGYGELVKYRIFGADSASKYGAVAVITMSITSGKDNQPYTGTLIYGGKYKKIPAVAIGYKDGKKLSSLLRKNSDLKLKLLLDCETKPDTISYNLICDLKGTDKKDEIVLVGGHIDSWDVGCGANDDAAGCIQSLEAIELFKRLNIKHRRTLRCVFFVNEENGIRGAKAYNKEFGNQNHIAVIESDRGCGTPRGFFFDSDSTILNKMQQYLPYLNISGIEWIKKGGSGADVAQIKNCKIKIGYVPDQQRYMDYHHSSHDTFDTIHYREFELGVASLATLVYILSNENF